MFKTTKSKTIFALIFCSICILITVGAIIYKNIEIDDMTKEEREEELKDVAGINLKGTYNQNDLTILEKRAAKDKVEITYCQINGLNNNVVQNNINKELENLAVNIYKDKVTNLDEVINVSVNERNVANFANTLSFEVSYVAKKDDDGDGFFQGYKCLNYDLTTGEKITFDKLFTQNAPMEEILRKSAYYSLVKRNVKTNLAGELEISDYGDVENEVSVFINKYKNEQIENFEFSPKTISVFWGENDDIIEINMSEYADYIAIYNRYLSDNNIFEKSDVGLKNLYTLSERNSTAYTYMNYQKGSNYFIDINLINYDGSNNEFSEKLKKEKIIELESEIEKIKNSISKNPDSFYILNYSINISTTYDEETMQNMTYCTTEGNSYEITTHDFEENIEPIIIKANRESGNGIQTYVYNFKDILNIEPQTTKEAYNPSTGEKIVI